MNPLDVFRRTQGAYNTFSQRHALRGMVEFYSRLRTADVPPADKEIAMVDAQLSSRQNIEAFLHDKRWHLPFFSFHPFSLIFLEAYARHPAPGTLYYLVQDECEFDKISVFTNTFLLGLLAHTLCSPDTPLCLPWFDKAYTRDLGWLQAPNLSTDMALYINLMHTLSTRINYSPSNRAKKMLSLIQGHVEWTLGNTPPSHLNTDKLCRQASALAVNKLLPSQTLDQVYSLTRPSDRAHNPWLYKKTPNSITLHNHDALFVFAHATLPSLARAAKSAITSTQDPDFQSLLAPFLSPMERLKLLLEPCLNNRAPLLTRSVFYAPQHFIDLTTANWAHLLSTAQPSLRPWLFTTMAAARALKTSQPTNSPIS